MFSTLLHILYVPVCIFLILVVLLQTGKRADLAGAFGGGGSQTAFGARGAATLLAKVTTASAILFMVVALLLSIEKTRQATGGGTVLDEVPDPVGSSAPIGLPEGDSLPVEGDATTGDDSGLPPLDAEEGATDDAEPAADPPQEGSEP